MAAELLVHAALFVFPSVAVLLIVTTPGVVGAAVRRGRAHGGPVPQGRPIECIAADLRHARRVLERLEPDASRFHRREARERYDALLAEACRATGIPAEALDEPTTGIDRDITRLTLEDALVERGLAPH